MGQVRGVTQRRTQQLSTDLKGEFFEVSTKSGHSYIGVQFDQKLPDGRTREFRTDLERMEFIEKQAAAYDWSGTREERFGQAGDMQFRFKRGSGPEVTVQLLQRARDGSEQWQGLKTDARTLRAAVDEGKSLERELGKDQRWHVLVDAYSLTKDRDGRIQAQAVESFASETDAKDRLGRSGGSLALSTEPQRREFKKGETVELWSEARVLLKGERETNSVEEQLGQSEWVRGRETEHYVLARWDDKNNKPVMDARTRVDGTGFEAASLKPEDYKAGYNPGRERGESGEPTWVIIEKDSGKLGLGNIRGISQDRDALVGEMKQKEGHKQDVQRAVGQDWDKQSTGVDRNQHTQGYSM